MRYRYYYKKYRHSKLATWLSSLQCSFWGVIAFAIIPAMPFFIIGVNMDIPALLIASAIIAIGCSIFLFKIDTDKIEERKIIKITTQIQHSRSSPQKKPFTYAQKIILARNLLIVHFMDMATDIADGMGEEEKEHFKSKFSTLEKSIKSFILEQEKIHGIIFLTEDNKKAKEINKHIGKRVFAITMYYALDLEQELNHHSMDEVVNAIVYTTEHYPNVDDSEFVGRLVDRLFTMYPIENFEESESSDEESYECQTDLSTRLVESKEEINYTNKSTLSQNNPQEDNMLFPFLILMAIGLILFLAGVFVGIGTNNTIAFLCGVIVGIFLFFIGLIGLAIKANSTQVQSNEQTKKHSQHQPIIKE